MLRNALITGALRNRKARRRVLKLITDYCSEDGDQKKWFTALRQRVPEELANYLDPIAKHLAEEVNEISDYLRTELLNE